MTKNLKILENYLVWRRQKKPVEVAPEQKVVEKVEKVSDIPVIGILEAPIEIPIESPVKSRA